MNHKWATLVNIQQDIYYQNSLSSYPSEPFTLDHINMRHPVSIKAKEYELQIKEIDCGRDCKVAVNQPRDLRSTFMQLSC